MRQWSGMHDGSLPVGNGLTTVRNVSFHRDGLCSRRPQLTTRYDLDAVVIQGLTHPLAGSFLVSADGAGALVGCKLSDGTTTSLATGLNYDIPGTLTNHQAKLYYNNDFDSTRRMERGDLSAVTAGISAPSVAPTVSATSGASDGTTHFFRYRYRDSRTGYLSNPSSSISSTAYASYVDIYCTASSDAKVTDIILEATTDNGSIYYQVGTRANTSGTVRFAVTDAVLEQGIDIDAIYGEFGHEPPPVVEIMCEHRGRMFGWKRSVRAVSNATVTLSSTSVTGTGFPTNSAWSGRLLTVAGTTSSYVIASHTSTTITLASNYAGSTNTAASISIFHPQPDLLYWSRAGFPESWKLATWARRVLQGGADEPSAMFSAYDTLWLCGQHSIRTFDYTSDPAAARLSAIPTEMGVYNQQCIVQADGRTFGFGQAGVFELQGKVPTRISDDIEAQLSAIIDTSQFTDFHGVYDPYERSATWYFTRTGDTSPKDGICYFLESGQWQFVSYRQPIRASVTYGSAALPYRPYLADANGWVWRVGEDRPGDCLPSTMSSGVLTTASASSTTVINIVESLPTGSGDCKGAMLYWPAAGEARAIASNTTNTITLSSGFTSAPGNGVTLYLGSIDVYLKSDWWMMRSPQHKKRPPYIAIEHLSEDTAPEAYLSVYQDLSGTATQWTTDSGDSRLLGVTATSSTVRTVDLGATESAGILYVELPDKFCKYWRWTLTQDKPAGALGLMDCQFLMQNAGDVDQNIKPV